MEGGEGGGQVRGGGAGERGGGRWGRRGGQGGMFITWCPQRGRCVWGRGGRAGVVPVAVLRCLAASVPGGFCAQWLLCPVALVD